jgi:hypothetical protein
MTQHDEFSRGIFREQVIAIALVAVAAAGVGLIELFWPRFFDYPYFSWQIRWNALPRFWPLFLYCLGLALWVTLREEKPSEPSSFLLSAKTSILAGIWEEVAYRCILVCYAMILIKWLNFVFSTVVGTVVGLALLVGSVLFFEREKRMQNLFLVFAMGSGVGILYLAWGVGGDPVYAIYRHIIIPFINIITLGSFREIFYNGYPELFVFGLVTANGWFRNGHEYQGLYGFIDSWIFGFVAMYAMLNYGLLTAVALHALFNLQIGVIRFVLKR